MCKFTITEVSVATLCKFSLASVFIYKVIIAKGF